MQLDIIFEAQTLEAMSQEINIHFEQEMKVHREQWSLFESYQVRPTQRHIMEVWRYRIVAKSGKYFFGKLRE
jgi:hypothetical protein